MSVAKIPCPHCQRTIALDTAKVPKKKFAFNCPACKGKVSIDPGKLGVAVEEEEEVAAAVAEQGDQALQDQPAESNNVETVLDLPPGAALPHCLMLGDNPAVIEQIKTVLEEHGSVVDVLDDPAAVAGIVPEEMPPLLVYAGGTAGAAPWAAARPVTSLPPRVRQRTFVVLVADDLVTLDGGKAFFYQANLLLNSADVSRAAAIIYSALQFHRRLYGPFLKALEVRETRAVSGE
jgi:hypothetical protein